MKARKNRFFVGDFETTVYDGQTRTEVWASACVEMFTDDVKIFGSIAEQFEYLKSLDCNIVLYYHNLKFDGSFWLSYLMQCLHFEQATEQIDAEGGIHFLTPNEMPVNTFTYSISGMGQWYRIIIKVGKKRIIELRDSLKLLPFSVEKIGNSFGTKHKKLKMEYKGYRYAGCEITDEEKKYIANDVLVVKEALEIMFTEGHKKLTIGSCCLAEYKGIMGKGYDILFPNLYDINLPSEYGADNVGEYIRKSYHGGWCYLARGKEKKKYTNGVTADVNSLYPSMMHSESGNIYPVGYPYFWQGNYIPEEALAGKYYFIRFRCRFYIKEGKLPFVQIKSSFLYKGTEMLETSDIYNAKDGKYYSEYYDKNSNLKQAIVELTMTMIDFKLFKEHYEIRDFEILDGCYFDARIGIFDEYIDKYKRIKMESKGAIRELAKLFLNNLYGKLASSTNSNFKVAYLNENYALSFYTQLDNGKTPGYIPCGSAITSYARNFTIRAAQANYYGPNKPGFIYADTDSIHCDLPPSSIKGVTIHPVNFCCWKLEKDWDEAFFVRQKTYIEHTVKEDGETIENPYYAVTCAGMPKKCKDLFIKSLEGYVGDEEYTDEEKEFLSVKRSIEDFNTGLRVPGKLMPKRIEGGTVLVDTSFEMK